MRNLKILLAVLVVFTLFLSACASDGGEGANDNAVIGNENVMEPSGTESGLDDTNSNANINENTNANFNGQDETVVATTEVVGVDVTTGTPEAIGTPMATEEDGLATGTTESMATPLGAAMGTAPVQTTGTPVDSGAQLTPMGTIEGTAMSTQVPGMAVEGHVGGVRLSDLIGETVNNASGVPVGVVDSVLIDQETCQVRYVLVSADEDDRLIPVPLAALFSEGQTGTLSSPIVLNVEDDLWINAPAWNVDGLPELHTDGWDVNLTPYWSGYNTGGNGLPANGNDNSNDNGTDNGNSNANDNAQPGAGASAAGTVRLSDVTDINVTNADGEDLGDIEDVILSLDNGEVAYVVLAVGGILDLGEDLVPVPCDRITWQWDDSADQPTAVLDVDKAIFEEAPILDDFPTSYESGWDAEWEAFWGGL